MGATEPPPCIWAMPDPADADEHGVAGFGADLEPGTLLAAYRSGLFPMPLGGHANPGPMGWWSPDPRGVLPLDGLRVSRSLRRSCARYEVRVDTAFEAVIDACAEPGRPGGWITPAIRTAYVELHRLGWAHSVETWAIAETGAEGVAGTRTERDPETGANGKAPDRDDASSGPGTDDQGTGGPPPPSAPPGRNRLRDGGDRHHDAPGAPSAVGNGGQAGDRVSVSEVDGRGELVGGLYGVAIGGLFAGESMFHTATDASKVALVALVDLLRTDGNDGQGRLLDVQWATDHLASLGAVDIPRAEYLRRLALASRLPPPPAFRTVKVR